MFITLLIVFAISYLAFALSAICGGGAGLILLPVLGRLLPVSQVPAGLTIGTFTSSASRIAIFYKNISWKIVKVFVPPAIPAVWLGAWLLKFVNPVYLEIIISLFLISNLVFLLKKQSKITEGSNPKKGLLIVIGFLTGLLSGLTGAVGLVFNRFYLRYNLTKQEIVATRAANEIVLHLIKLVRYTLFGLISLKVIGVGCAVALAGLLSSFTMKYVLPFMSEKLFQKIGYTAMVLSGGVILAQAGTAVFIQNNASLSTAFVSSGAEAKLQWQGASVSLELTYDEGFEFEQVIPFNILSQSQQLNVLAQQKEADKIVIEAVHSFSGKSYEAYYYQQGKLIDKIDFD